MTSTLTVLATPTTVGAPSVVQALTAAVSYTAAIAVACKPPLSYGAAPLVCYTVTATPLNGAHPATVARYPATGNLTQTLKVPDSTTTYTVAVTTTNLGGLTSTAATKTGVPASGGGYLLPITDLNGNALVIPPGFPTPATGSAIPLTSYPTTPQTGPVLYGQSTPQTVTGNVVLSQANGVVNGLLVIPKIATAANGVQTVQGSVQIAADGITINDAIMQGSALGIVPVGTLHAAVDAGATSFVSDGVVPPASNLVLDLFASGEELPHSLPRSYFPTYSGSGTPPPALPGQVIPVGTVMSLIPFGAGGAPTADALRGHAYWYALSITGDGTTAAAGSTPTFPDNTSTTPVPAGTTVQDHNVLWKLLPTVGFAKGATVNVGSVEVPLIYALNSPLVNAHAAGASLAVTGLASGLDGFGIVNVIPLRRLTAATAVGATSLPFGSLASSIAPGATYRITANVAKGYAGPPPPTETFKVMQVSGNNAIPVSPLINAYPKNSSIAVSCDHQDIRANTSWSVKINRVSMDGRGRTQVAVDGFTPSSIATCSFVGMQGDIIHTSSAQMVTGSFLGLPTPSQSSHPDLNQTTGMNGDGTTTCYFGNNTFCGWNSTGTLANSAGLFGRATNNTVQRAWFDGNWHTGGNKVFAFGAGYPNLPNPGVDLAMTGTIPQRDNGYNFAMSVTRSQFNFQGGQPTAGQIILGPGIAPPIGGYVWAPNDPTPVVGTVTWDRGYNLICTRAGTTGASPAAVDGSITIPGGQGTNGGKTAVSGTDTGSIFVRQIGAGQGGPFQPHTGIRSGASADPITDGTVWWAVASYANFQAGTIPVAGRPAAGQPVSVGTVWLMPGGVVYAVCVVAGNVASTVPATPELSNTTSGSPIHGAFEDGTATWMTFPQGGALADVFIDRPANYVPVDSSGNSVTPLDRNAWGADNIVDDGTLVALNLNDACRNVTAPGSGNGWGALAVGY